MDRQRTASGTIPDDRGCETKGREPERNTKVNFGSRGETQTVNSAPCRLISGHGSRGIERMAQTSTMEGGRAMACKHEPCVGVDGMRAHPKTSIWNVPSCDGGSSRGEGGNNRAHWTVGVGWSVVARKQTQVDVAWSRVMHSHDDDTNDSGETDPYHCLARRTLGTPSHLLHAASLSVERRSPLFIGSSSRPCSCCPMDGRLLRSVLLRQHLLVEDAACEFARRVSRFLRS